MQRHRGQELDDLVGLCEQALEHWILFESINDPNLNLSLEEFIDCLRCLVQHLIEARNAMNRRGMPTFKSNANILARSHT